MDLTLERLEIRRRPVLGCPVLLEERLRDLVDALVRGLGRQDGRDQQLPGVLVLETAPGVGEFGPQDGDDILGPFAASLERFEGFGVGHGYPWSGGGSQVSGRLDISGGGC